MSNINLNQSLKKKIILLTFLIVCSLLFSEKALAVWGGDDCKSFHLPDKRKIMFCFKFFEYNADSGNKNSFLESFEALYSTDDGRSYKHLMSASTKDQNAKNWAWIQIKNKKVGEKLIPNFYSFRFSEQISINWNEGKSLKLNVKNSDIKINQTWFAVEWFLREDQYDITQIQFSGKWVEKGKTPKYPRATAPK